jgi:hypothetical protein
MEEGSKKGLLNGALLSYTHAYTPSLSRARSEDYQCTTVPEYSEHETSVADPTARPTPLLPKKAADAPESLHRSKLTFAPYWFVPVRPLCEHSGLPSAGQRLFTVGIISTCYYYRRQRRSGGIGYGE